MWDFAFLVFMSFSFCLFEFCPLLIITSPLQYSTICRPLERDFIGREARRKNDVRVTRPRPRDRSTMC